MSKVLGIKKDIAAQQEMWFLFGYKGNDLLDHEVIRECFYQQFGEPIEIRIVSLAQSFEHKKRHPRAARDVVFVWVQGQRLNVSRSNPSVSRWTISL